MTRKRLLGVLGLAATLSVPTTITAHAAATTDTSTPLAHDDATGRAAPANSGVPITATYGTGKVHIGVRLADGTYDTTAPPDLTGAKFELDETGPNQVGDGKALCTLAAKPTDDLIPGDEPYAYLCNFGTGTTEQSQFIHYIGDSDVVSVHQLTSPAGVLVDPKTYTPPVCVDPPDSPGTCWYWGTNVYLTLHGLSPVAANFGKVVNHGLAQTIDVLAKSQTAGAKPTLTIAKKPAHGTAVVRSNKIVYTPSSTYGGADTFSYTLKTVHGSSVGTVHLAVQVPPLARADTAHTKGSATKHGKPVSVAVLANDLARGSALKGLAVSTKPKHGTATVSGTKIKYTPAKGFHGKDVLTYLVKNAYGTAKATLTITVAKP